jgi:hypothetical protein
MLARRRLYSSPLAVALTVGLIVSASAAPTAWAAKPLINLGPKSAPTADAIEFSAGESLAPVASKIVWRNERGGVAGVKQVVIPSFQVEFVTNSAATSNGQSLASASVSYQLLGPSPEDMQAITDAIYGQFLNDLAQTGVTVIPLEDAQARSPGMRRLMNLAKPAPYERGTSNHSAFYSPPGMKFYFTPLDGRAAGFSGTMVTNGSHVPEEMAMNELNAGVMGVRIVVDFAEIQARGRGVLGMRPPTAKVKSKANVSISAVESQLWVITPKAKSTYMDLGHRQRYALTSPILLPDSVISAVDTTTTGSKVTDGVVGAIGILSGSGMGQKRRTYEVTVDPKVWRADVTAAGTEVSRALLGEFKSDL